jgi:ornithine cyclodeaminase/alanine dehydrogenase-like protein (mu-crystallin family)
MSSSEALMEPQSRQAFGRKGGDEMSNASQLEVVGAANPEAAVRESDVVLATSPSHRPIIKAEWLHPGLHIAAVGVDAPERQEIEARASEKVDLIACDLKSQSFVRGELHHAMEAASDQRGPR